MGKQLLSVAVVILVGQMVSLTYGNTLLENNFMDCEGNDNNLWGIYRRCCPSPELPNDCECFDISRITDFVNSGFHKPQCPDHLNVKFFLYTRDEPTEGIPIKAGQENIESTPFDGSKKTLILTHGFTDYAPNPWMDEIRDNLFKAEDMNVVFVDWKDGATPPNYYQAAANTRTVGAMVARLIDDLRNFAGAHFGSFHLAGHSLGSHIMGIAGKEIWRLRSQLVGRITGLDPAGPSFESYSARVRLDSSDAQFVDVIHSDAEDLLSSGFGIRKSIGHVDFWPNGGDHQPGCPEETGGLLSLLSFEDEINAGACSHSMANRFFSHSINDCTYGDTECHMGYHVDHSCRGDIYLETTATTPYC